MRNSTDGNEEEEDEFYDNDGSLPRDHHDDDVMRSDTSTKAKRKGGKVSKKKHHIKGPEYNVPEDATPESMTDINDKLKSELEQLIEAVEVQIQRVRQEKEEDRKQLMMREDPDADVRKKENELKRAQAKIQTLKKEIMHMKKQIDNAYDVEKTLDLENDLKGQESVYAKLVSEVTSLKKVEKQQNKAFTLLNEDEDANRRLDSIKEEVTKVKQEIREKNETLRTVDEQMKNQHAQMVEMEMKCRKITQALRKQNLNKSQVHDESEEQLTDDQVKERIGEIEELEAIKKQEEKKYERLIRQVEAKITQVEHDKNIWAIKLKEKDQEYRLNELRIKELKRQVPHKALKPLHGKESGKNSKVRKQRAPADQNRGHVKKANPKPKVSKQASVEKKKTKDAGHDPSELDHNEPKDDVFTTQMEADEPKQSKKVDSDHEDDDKKPGFQKLPTDKSKKSVKDDKDDDSGDDMGDKEKKSSPVKLPTDNDDDDPSFKRRSVVNQSPIEKRGGNYSKLSKESDGKEGFYDNSFIDDKEANQNKNDAKNVKSKPFDIKPKQDSEDGYDDDDGFDQE